MRLLIYSKPDCHLCEQAKTVLEKVATEFGIALEEIDIEQDSESFNRFRYDIPVIYLDDTKLFKHKVDEQKLRKAITSRL